MCTVRISKRILFNIIKKNRSTDYIKNSSDILQYILNEFGIDKNNINIVNQIRNKVGQGFLSKYYERLKVLKNQKIAFSNFEDTNAYWLDKNLEISYRLDYSEPAKKGMYTII